MPFQNFAGLFLLLIWSSHNCQSLNVIFIDMNVSNDVRVKESENKILAYISMVVEPLAEEEGPRRAARV